MPEVFGRPTDAEWDAIDRRAKNKKADAARVAEATNIVNADEIAKGREVFDRVVARENKKYDELANLRKGISAMPEQGNSGQALADSMASRIHQVEGASDSGERTAIVERPKPPKKGLLDKLKNKIFG